MSRAASPGWHSHPGGDLTKRQRATLRANWQELAEYLAAPGIAWSWGESGLSERLKHYLRHHSLIVRDPDDPDCWQTTEKLWVAVLQDANDDETIGAGAEGQCKLPEEARASTPARCSGVLHTTAAGSGVNGTRQATLTGDIIDPSETVNDDATDTELVERNLSKGERDDPAERGDGQPPLTRWTGIDADVNEWDVTVDADGPRLRRIDA